MVLVGHRLLTCLGLTSLVATMMMVTRYNLTTTDRPVRKMVTFNSPLISANQRFSDHHPIVHRPQHNQLNHQQHPLNQADRLSEVNRPNKATVRHNQRNPPQIGAESNSSPTSSLRSPLIALIASSTSVPASSSLANNQEVALSSSTKQLTAINTTVNEVTAKPKTVFDAEDLKTTEKFIIDKPLFCDTDKGATLDLLVVVTSAVTHFDAREAIRKTWGQFAVERGALLLFLLGATTNQSLQDVVVKEEQMYGDILQGAFVDNYYNLTLKTISLMRWVNETCRDVKYVLKVDDDMFVNMQMMVDFSETRTFNKAIIGKLARKWRPHRDPKSKW